MPDYNLTAEFTHIIRSRPQNSPIGLQNTQRKILRNFVKFYLDVDKIAAAMDKICSSLDKIARDNR